MGHYFHMYRPTEIKQEVEIHWFRKGHSPMWENFKSGGTWILKENSLTTEKQSINWRWEMLLLSMIGEEFPSTIKGASLSIRS